MHMTPLDTAAKARAEHTTQSPPDDQDRREVLVVTPLDAAAEALDEDHERSGFTLGFVEHAEHRRYASLVVTALLSDKEAMVEAVAQELARASYRDPRGVRVIIRASHISEALVAVDALVAHLLGGAS